MIAERDLGTVSSKAAATAPSKRLSAIEPYRFQVIEQIIEEKKRQGIDVISLGIGDPDHPTPPAIVDEMARSIAKIETHKYPTNRGRLEFREAFARFYLKRFGVVLDPETQVVPVVGAKECIFNLNLAFLDPGDVALASDPGYPVYTGGPMLAGAESHRMPLVPEAGFIPDLDSIPPSILARSRLMFINYPNNPTGAIVPEGFFDRVVEFGSRNRVLVVHDNAYSETTFDGYTAPSFLATEGAMDAGVEVFSLSKGFNMTGWRVGAIVGNADAVAQYWRLKTNVDSGLFEAIQLTAAFALENAARFVKAMNPIYRRRRDLVVDALGAAGVAVTSPKATIYVWAPVPEGFTSESFATRVLEKAAVVVGPGSAYGPGGEGFFRISLTVEDSRLEEAMDRIRELL